MKEILSYKSITSTQVYIHADRALFHHLPPEEFHARVARTQEDIKDLIGTCYEYILQKDSLA